MTVVDTGDDTMTGGRILRIKDFIEDETFLLTYGDGLADVDIKNLLAHHEKNQCLATLTAVRPPGRFGVVKFPCNGESRIQSFEEKTDSNETWINGITLPLIGVFLIISKMEIVQFGNKNLYLI